MLSHWSSCAKAEQSTESTTKGRIFKVLILPKGRLELHEVPELNITWDSGDSYQNIGHKPVSRPICGERAKRASRNIFDAFTHACACQSQKLLRLFRSLVGRVGWTGFDPYPRLHDMERLGATIFARALGTKDCDWLRKITTRTRRVTRLFDDRSLIYYKSVTWFLTSSLVRGRGCAREEVLCR